MKEFLNRSVEGKFKGTPCRMFRPLALAASRRTNKENY